MIERMNWSTLRYLAVSPKYMKHRVEHPRPDTDALKLGRAVHCLVLEPKAFESRWVSQGQCAATKKGGDRCSSTGSLYLEGDWFCKVKGHAPTGAGAPPEGIEVISADGMELAKACAQAVHRHPVAQDLLDVGKAEESMEWTHKETGIACRGRVDFLRSDCLVDLKVTRRETVRDIKRDVAAYRFHSQLAWYHDGAIAAGKLKKDAERPYLIAVSNAEPYDVAVFRMPLVTYQAGEIDYRDLLIKYRDCLAADVWPGIAPDLLELDLPPWSPGMQGSEEGTGDEF
jgi:hypothetical protein